MRALYIPSLPRNPERHQEQWDQTTVMGARVFGWTALCALLEYGTYDAYFVPGLTDQKKEELMGDGLTAASVKRLVGVPIGSKLPITNSDQVVLMAFDPQLRTLATTRRKLQRYDAPVCGLIHSINSERVVFAILVHYFAGLCEADLLFCSSRAGMRTIEVYIEELGRSLPPTMAYRPRRVLVPLGVTIPPLEPEHRINLRQRLNIGAEETITLFFGRLSQMSKGDLGPLLVAFSKLLSTGVTTHLIIAGDDTQTNEARRLTALASELGCIQNLTIWPNPSANDKHMLYSGADIFVSPSDNIQETFGLTVAEALSYGLPAVVSDWDGYRDLVSDGETGFLVPSLFPSSVENLELRDCSISMVEEDSLAQSTTIDIPDLSEKIQTLVHNPSLRIQMGRAARQSAEEHYSWPVIVKRYEHLWGESIQTAKTAPWEEALTSAVFRMSLEKSFGHFATEKRDPHCKCFITAEGREWLKRPARFYFLCHLYGPPTPQRFNQMLGEIAARPGIPATKVVETLDRSADHASAFDAHWGLGRLFKYGLVSSTEECRVTCDHGGNLQALTHDFGTNSIGSTVPTDTSGTKR
jgi:glycosyltransferase involved in cell wall biosynthesis